MFPLLTFSDTSTERFPACCPSLPACHLPTVLTITLFFNFSPFLPISFPHLDHVSVALIVFYPFHWNLALSPTKPKADPISLPSCFCLARPLFTLPPALASLQPYTLHLVCLFPLTPSSSHAYCSFALFLESQHHLYYDLALLSSSWPAPCSCWLC